MSIGQELLNAPFPQMVRSLGIGIAEAQYAMDRVSIRIAQQMAGMKANSSGEMVRDDASLVRLQENGESYSLLALGFTPTFYQFVETVIELKMSFSMTTSREVGVSATIEAGANWGIASVSASVTASYSQKYQYSAEGSSLMRTKLVAVPAPAVFEQRIRELIKIENQESEA